MTANDLIPATSKAYRSYLTFVLSGWCMAIATGCVVIMASRLESLWPLAAVAIGAMGVAAVTAWLYIANVTKGAELAAILSLGVEGVKTAKDIIKDGVTP